MKAILWGLWSIWLSGFVLIGLSLYATHRLSHHIQTPKRLQENLQRQGNTYIKITVFSAPKPFNGSIGDKQTLAIQSWLACSPYIFVVLFSKHPSVVSFAAAFGSRVSVEPDIDFTFLGTAFFHSMIAKSRSSKSNIYVLVEPETIILSGFISTLNHAYQLDYDWFLFASSQNVSFLSLPLDNIGLHWQRDNEEWVKIHKEILKQGLQWNHCDGRMLMAWNNGDLPLHDGVLPPFLYGKGVHNYWVVHETMSSQLRFVFDASSTISSFHLDDHNMSSPLVGGFTAPDGEQKNWEYVGNSHLGAIYGSFYTHKANYSSQVKLLKCQNQYIFVNTKKNIIFPLEYQWELSQQKKRILNSSLKNIFSCINGMEIVEGLLNCSIRDCTRLTASLDFPFSLETLLAITAGKNKTVVLAVAGYSYKDMLMSWVCRLRRLLITNFIVCALDQETYHFSILQGLPVFKDPLAPSDTSFNDCHFGTKCFQRVTKVKSRIALKILKLGYNVLLSDVDVYWFKNPLPLLHSFGPQVLVVQSDEYNGKGPINLPRRLNSGFYFAHSDGATIAALEKVVRHAATSTLSEQPSFYDTLCGERGSNRIGDDSCLEPETNLTVHFLDRNLFPNGAYLGLWQEKNVKAACARKRCFIIHNNWISGRLKKLERQMFSGLWDYDPSTRMCLPKLAYHQMN